MRKAVETKDLNRPTPAKYHRIDKSQHQTHAPSKPIPGFGFWRISTSTAGPAQRGTRRRVDTLNGRKMKKAQAWPRSYEGQKREEAWIELLTAFGIQSQGPVRGVAIADRWG